MPHEPVLADEPVDRRCLPERGPACGGRASKGRARPLTPGQRRRRRRLDIRTAQFGNVQLAPGNDQATRPKGR